MTVTAQTPPTTTPVLRRIKDNLVETLQTITVQNGYSFNATVEAPNPSSGDTEADGTIVMALAEAADDPDRPQTMDQYRQLFLVGCVCRVSEDAAQPDINDVRIKRIAEIAWCVTYDPYTSSTRPNQTRGGIAEDTSLVAVTLLPMEPGDSTANIILEFEVLYRQVYHNPFASPLD